MFIDKNAIFLATGGAMAATTGALASTNLVPLETESVMLVLDATGAAGDIEVEILAQATDVAAPAAVAATRIRYGIRHNNGGALDEKTVYSSVVTDSNGKFVIDDLPPRATLEVAIPLEVRRSKYNFDVKFTNLSGAGRLGALLVIRDHGNLRYTYNT